MFQNHKPLVRNSGLGGAASTAQWLDSVLIASISREFSDKPLAEAMGFLTKIAADSHRKNSVCGKLSLFRSERETARPIYSPSILKSVTVAILFMNGFAVFVTDALNQAQSSRDVETTC